MLVCFDIIFFFVFGITAIVTQTLFLLFLSRWRGALHHSGNKDDDGCLVDVCSYCHFLIYCQSSSLSYHHTYRELYTVSIQQFYFLHVHVAVLCSQTDSLFIENKDPCIKLHFPDIHTLQNLSLHNERITTSTKGPLA